MKIIDNIEYRVGEAIHNIEQGNVPLAYDYLVQASKDICDLKNKVNNLLDNTLGENHEH